jgi:hypothetical protein
MCPSSGETTVFMRLLILVILKQAESLKLQGRMPLYDIRPCNFKAIHLFQNGAWGGVVVKALRY